MAKIIPLNTLNNVLIGVPAADIVTAIQLPNNELEIRRKSYRVVQKYKGALSFLNLAEGTVLVTVKGSGTPMIINMLHVVDLQPITNSPLDGTRIIFTKESKAGNIDVTDTIVSIDSDVVCCTNGGTDICGSMVDPVGAVTVLRVTGFTLFTATIQSDLGGGEFITRLTADVGPSLPDMSIQLYDNNTGELLRDYTVTSGVAFFDFQYNSNERPIIMTPSESSVYTSNPPFLDTGSGAIFTLISGGGTLNLQALDISTISKYTLTNLVFGTVQEVDLVNGNPMKDGLAPWCVAGGDVNNINFVLPITAAVPYTLLAHIEFNNGCPNLDLEYIWDTTAGTFTLN